MCGESKFEEVIKSDFVNRIRISKSKSVFSRVRVSRGELY